MMFLNQIPICLTLEIEVIILDDSIRFIPTVLYVVTRYGNKSEFSTALVAVILLRNDYEKVDDRLRLHQGIEMEVKPLPSIYLSILSKFTLQNDLPRKFFPKNEIKKKK